MFACHLPKLLIRCTWRTVDHRTEKLPNKAVSTHEIINKTEEGADKATGSCDYTEHAGFAYCQLADSR